MRLKVKLERVERAWKEELRETERAAREAEAGKHAAEATAREAEAGKHAAEATARKAEAGKHAAEELLRSFDDFEEPDDEDHRLDRVGFGLSNFLKEYRLLIEGRTVTKRQIDRLLGAVRR